MEVYEHFSCPGFHQVFHLFLALFFCVLVHLLCISMLHRSSMPYHTEYIASKFCHTGVLWWFWKKLVDGMRSACNITSLPSHLGQKTSPVFLQPTVWSLPLHLNVPLNKHPLSTKPKFSWLVRHVLNDFCTVLLVNGSFPYQHIFWSLLISYKYKRTLLSIFLIKWKYIFWFTHLVHIEHT